MLQARSLNVRSLLVVLLGSAVAPVLDAQDSRGADPRIELVALQQQGKIEAALERARQIEAEQEELAQRFGLPYLRGHLLEQLGRSKEASSAFAEVLQHPTLGPYARYRIALVQEQLGHPEVSAGLVATLLGSSPPKHLVDPATRLLVRTIENGGDCRLLNNIAGLRLPSLPRRRLQLARADCQLEEGDLEQAMVDLRRLLDEKITDLPGREAAYRILAIEFPDSIGEDADRVLVARLGRTFHHHREFERASVLLRQPISSYPERLTSSQFENYYRYARAGFWLGNYNTASRLYQDLATRAPSNAARAQAHFNEARAHELSGDWEAAILAYQNAYDASQLGRYSSASLIAELRLRWRREEENEALAILDALRGRRAWRAELARAALFLAVSDIVQKRPERAAAWLDTANSASRSISFEVGFWRARLAELEGRQGEAVDLYALVLRTDRYHPLGQAALRRLKSEDLSGLAQRTGERLAQSQEADDLLTAWALLGEESAIGRSALATYSDFVRKTNTTAATFLDLAPARVEEWGLWRAPIRQPEELLLALGLWDEGGPVATRHFPISKPDLALAAGQELVQVAQVRRGLLIGQILLDRKPSDIPHALLPKEYRKILFPYSYSALLRRAEQKYEVDSHLLAAIIRQESAFNPTAVSAVSARGLTQFVHDTAVRLAAEAGLESFTPADLEDPEVAINLGGAYVRDLGRRYDNREHQMVAAYNAGEPQAELWQSYCYSTEQEEYYSKVTFRETRDYLKKVLSGRAQYREIWD